MISRKEEQVEDIVTFRAVIFDLFRTLVDPDGFKPSQYHRTRKVAEILSASSEEFRRYWAKTVPSRQTRRSETVSGLLGTYVRANGIKATREEISMAEYEWGRYHDLAILTPRKDVELLLTSLRDKNVKLGLLSNADEREIRQWPHSPLSGRFDAECFSCDIGCRKPDTRSYEIVLARLNLPSSVSVFVGDGEDGELEGARRAGFGKVIFMKGVVESRKTQSRFQMVAHEAAADATIESLGDLPDVVRF